MTDGTHRRWPELELADWRRRIAELYAAVRSMRRTQPAGALALWRDTREQLYRTHAQSPVPAGERAGFRAHHFPHDPALAFEVPVVDRPEPATRSPGRAPTDLGGPALRRIGRVEIPFAAGTRALAVFWLDDYAGGLFIPFRDATAGAATYAAGRYVVDTAKGADLGGDPELGTLVVDFNYAYQPSCAFDPRWACPLAPVENHLDIAVTAGERLA